MVRRIVKGVYCELEDAVSSILKEDNDAFGEQGHGKDFKADWLKKWGAQITLTLTVDEASEFNPGITFKQPITPAAVGFPGVDLSSVGQSFAFGVGGRVGASAKRMDKINLYFTVVDMLDNRKSDKFCKHMRPSEGGRYYVIQHNETAPDSPHGKPRSADFQSPILMQSNLGIQNALGNAIFAEQIAGDDFLLNMKGDHAENAIQHEVKFKVATGGSITPSWSLVRVSATDGKLFDASRERIHDLLITFGPDKLLAAQKEKPQKGKAIRELALLPDGSRLRPAGGGGLDQSAAFLHFSSQIGQSIDQSLRFR